MKQDSRPFAIVFHNDEYINAELATVNVHSMAMRYGLSVFEGIRGYRYDTGQIVPFMLQLHLRRLQTSLQLMHLPDPGINKIPEIISYLLKENSIHEDSYIRPSIHVTTLGDMSLKPECSLTVHVSKMGRKKWLMEDIGMRATVSSLRKMPPDVFPSKAKCISSYASSYLGSTLAKAAGYDVPLFLNHKGYLTEAPTAALFVARNDSLIYPPLTDGILPSITAFVLKELAQQLGIYVIERHLRPEDIVTADEALLCGTGIEIAPIASLDGMPIRNFTDRPITRNLIKAYFSLARGQGKIEARYDI